MRDYVPLCPSSGTLVKCTTRRNRRKPNTRQQGRATWLVSASVFDALADLLKRSIVGNCMVGLGVTLFKASKHKVEATKVSKSWSSWGWTNSGSGLTTARGREQSKYTM